ncbi:MAG: helix-turn-helix domain-containing protein, partial [Nitrososphaera sp.]|nr:helix-turn-helix domain-containing protein [Nitrososphaera sp.]
FDRPEVDAFKHDIYRNLLRTILLLAERHKCSEAQPIVLVQYGEFVRFREQVEVDFSRTRKVQDYAITLGYSPKKLNQVTQAVLNKNAKLFVDERVILEIKRLLIHTNLSIKEITDQTGFDEPTNLVKFFKRYTLQTPLAFREQLALLQT